MADIAELGIKVDSRDVNEADKSLDELAQTAGNTETKVDSSSKKMGLSFSAFSKIALGAITTVAASAVALGTSFANQTAEMVNQARLANTTTEQFQELAYAAKTVGVEQDKVSDILKDFNDRVGDYLQTGGGPLVDFFDDIAPKMGITAEELSKLSGAEGLQVFTKALEDANLSQSEMVFQMEAITSDSTALLPLLKNNSQALKQLAAEAHKYGIVLDQETISNVKAFKEETRQLTAIQTGFKNQIASALLPTLSTFNQVILDLVGNTDAASIVADAFSIVLRGVSIAAIAAGTTIGNVGRAIGGLAAAAVQAAKLNFSEAGDIIKQFTKDNEEATAKAEDAMLKLWKNEGVNPPVEVQTRMDNINSSIRTLGRDTAVADEAAKEAAKTYSELADKVSEFQFAATTIGMTKDQIELYKLALDGATLSQLNLVAASQAAVSEFEKNKTKQQELELLMTKNDELITGASSATRAYSQTIGELNTLLDAGKISQEEYNTAIGRAQDKYDELVKKGNDSFEQLGGLAKEAAKSSQSALSDFLFDPFDKGLGGMVDSFANTLKRMAADAAAAGIMQGLLGFLPGGSSSGGGGGLGGLFAGFFDSGGTIGRGQFGVVGERGPELVTGPASIVGRHQTASMMSGKSDANVTVNITTPPGTTANVKQTEGPNGLNIDVVIDEMMANKINQSGSKTDRALKSKFGLRNQLANR